MADDTIMFLKTSVMNAEGLAGAFTRNGGEKIRVAQVEARSVGMIAERFSPHPNPLPEGEGTALVVLE